MAGSSVTERIDPLRHKVQAEKSTDHADIVLPDGAAEPSDDSPTIISKASPSSIKRREDANIDGIRGRTLGQFELIESIGVGGMAAVLRARDKQLDRCVALKILPPEMANDSENIRRFHEEARAAARLDHENIARVFCYAEDQGLHFIAFEFVEGKNIRELLDARGGPLPVAEALHYILQIGCGLEHASSRGVVHRDIKPSNIIITPTGRAKLVDMGLARRIGRTEEGALTQSGVTLGTFDYISPEQALEPREADTRSDIYSLGCTFYHMITGHAPVPEGTAAKKLHHHQHVAPLDPRELNPQVPDEVAAILARMMAKDPRARYQTPRHLVQHLLQAAQMLGSAPDMPNDVLFVDTPLPRAPQKQPLLILSLAAVLLGAFLFALSLSPQRGTPKFPIAVNPAPLPGPKDKGTPTPVVQQSIVGGHLTRKVTDEAELRQALSDPGITRIILKNSLSGIVQPLVAATSADESRELIIEPESEKEPVKISVHIPGVFDQQSAIGGGLWAGLILHSKGTVTFRNMHFVLDGRDVTPDVVVAAVALRGTGRFMFEKCLFYQKEVPLDIPDHNNRFPISSVLVEGVNRQGKQPHLTFDRCFFREGQVAVALLGAAQVRSTDCAFGPHAALFNLKAETLEPRSKLELVNCSALVRGPAFRLDDAAACTLTTRHCLFSSTGSTHPSLILQTDTISPMVVYNGYRNCYHNLNVYWGRPHAEERTAMTHSAFQAAVRGNGGEDKDSSELADSVNPLASATPLKELELVKPGLLADAFKVNPELLELREADVDKDPVRHTLPLGITWATRSGTLAALAPKLPELPRLANQILVNPDAKESPATGVYSSLDRAIANAKSRDEILIVPGKSRIIEVQPVSINVGVDLTIKPYSSEHRPILTLATPKNLNSSVPLLTIHDSRVVFENVEVVLEPQLKFSEAAVVELVGNGQCIFRRCVVTLKGTSGVPLYTAMLRERKNEMAMVTANNPRLAPVVDFIDTFVRGEGDLLRVPASRPFELNLNNSLIAVTGALVRTHGVSNDKIGIDVAAHIRLDRVSVFLGESLMTLHGGSDGRGLVPVRVDPVDHCLFVSMKPRTPLVSMIDVQVGEEALMEVVKWNGGVNAYCGFDDVLLRHVRNDIFALISFNKEAWKGFSRETNSEYVPIRMPASMTERPLSQATLDDFVPFKEMLQEFGAALNASQFPPLRGNASLFSDLPTIETLQVDY